MMSVTPNLEEQVDERQISVLRWCCEFFLMPKNVKNNLFCFFFFKHIKQPLLITEKSENTIFQLSTALEGTIPKFSSLK